MSLAWVGSATGEFFFFDWCIINQSHITITITIQSLTIKKGREKTRSSCRIAVYCYYRLKGINHYEATTILQIYYSEFATNQLVSTVRRVNDIMSTQAGMCMRNGQIVIAVDKRWGQTGPSVNDHVGSGSIECNRPWRIVCVIIHLLRPRLPDQ